MAPADIDEHPLLIAPALQVVGAIPRSVLWAVGHSWIRCESGDFYLDADEPITYEQVKSLLIETNGEASQWTVQEPEDDASQMTDYA